MSEILPGYLYLGNFRDSQNWAFLRRIRARVIVNCSKDLPFAHEAALDPAITKYRIPVNDDLRPESIAAMTVALGHIIPRLVNHYHRGEPIFVHCYAGMQRSAVVTLALLYALQTPTSRATLSDQDLITFLRGKREIVFFPGFNFEEAYRRWKTTLQEEEVARRRRG